MSPIARRNRRTRARLGWSAAALGAAALFNAWSARKAERDHPPEGSFLEVDGVPVHFTETGEGPALVLIHGNGALIGDFASSGIVERLAQDHRVIIFDRPGAGYTGRSRGRFWTPEKQAALLHAAARQLGADKPIVVGHSWGTLVALAWALDFPADIERVVLASGYYFPTPRPDVIGFTPVMLPGLGDLYAGTVAPLQARLVTPLGVAGIFAPAKPTPGFVNGFPASLAYRPRQLRATAVDTGQMTLAAARLAKRYGALTLPVTLIHGDGDKVVGISQAERFVAAVPQARLERFEEAGHMVHHIDPERFARVVAQATPTHSLDIADGEQPIAAGETAGEHIDDRAGFFVDSDGDEFARRPAERVG